MSVAVLRHRHPCPGCAKVWTHRIAPNVCRAYSGEPLRCGLCQLADHAGARADRRGERIAWAVGLLGALAQGLMLAWMLA